MGRIDEKRRKGNRGRRERNHGWKCKLVKKKRKINVADKEKKQ